MNPRLAQLLASCLVAAAAGQEIGRLQFRDDGTTGGGPTVVIDLTEPEPGPAAPMAGMTDPAATPADAAPASAPAPAVQPAGEPAGPDHDGEPGLVVRISGFSGDAAKLDPAKISLQAPFPAKPLGPAPGGWKLIRPDAKVPVFESRAELAPGSGIQLKIRPHVLVPQADGNHVIAVSEPGFNPLLEYRQAETVAALLGESVRRIEQEDAQLTKTIHRLEQLLISLPRPEP